MRNKRYRQYAMFSSVSAVFVRRALERASAPSLARPFQEISNICRYSLLCSAVTNAIAPRFASALKLTSSATSVSLSRIRLARDGPLSSLSLFPLMLSERTAVPFNESIMAIAVLSPILLSKNVARSSEYGINVLF